MDSIVKFSNIFNKFNILIDEISYGNKNHIFYNKIVNSTINIKLYLKEHLLFTSDIHCKNNNVYIHCTLILNDYLKITIYNKQVIFCNIIKINRTNYQENLNDDKLELLKLCNKIKIHIQSKHFIIVMEQKIIISNQLDNISYNIFKYNKQKTLEIFVKLQKRFFISIL
uniref:Uncharacterized protein n=1 Tax=Megaviridae environmental sample TaxID=1737588 RepID=A0A5J6VL98_9VIRU|nr:MAG: hypothetical protein [Megaviridae environmental sample]